MSLKPDHEERVRLLLAEAEAAPEDPEAQIVARYMRELLADKPPNPFADHMSELVSEYALACMDENQAERIRLVREIRLMIASALVPTTRCRDGALPPI